MLSSNLDKQRIPDEVARQHARQLIEDIAAKNGIFSDEFKQRATEGDRDKRLLMESVEELKNKLTKAVDNLSENLYKSQARFVLECIQNADDNKYPEEQNAFIRLTVGEDFIQIESNETGFQPADVKAISSICESTKAGEGAAALEHDSSELIGEKGIGFKSVFKIASQAHIRSLPFIFMFDKDRELGMITPLWDEAFFEARESSSDAQTEIVLMAPPRDGSIRNYAEDLKEDFMILQATFLMFLRRLKYVQINICPTKNQGSINRSFHMVEFENKRVQIRETRKSMDVHESTSNYYRFSHRIMDPPADIKRPGAATTSICLAFPIKSVDHHWEPLEAQQSVFAFLPISEFGFKFIIQADFITTSDREGIEEDRPWNIALRSTIAETFGKITEAFLDDEGYSSIRYTWIRYLSKSSAHKTRFWQRLDEALLKNLKTRNVIVSGSGSLLKPESATITSWAHDRHMMPLFGPESDYVSQHYQVVDQEYLLMLGVQTPSAEWVMKQLQKLNSNGELTCKSTTWHEDLAKVINNHVGSQYDKQLRQLPLIPCNNHGWVSSPTSDSDAIYFAESLGINVPVDINFNLLEKNAAMDGNRRKLFERLGVKSCRVQDVINRITDKHSRVMNGEDLHWSTDILVSHSWYIYQATQGQKIQLRSHKGQEFIYGANHEQNIQLRLPEGQDFIYLATDEGQPKLGQYLYADRSCIPDALYKSSSPAQDFLFLHPLYLEACSPQERSKFISWLEKMSGLARTLRFEDKCTGLHPHFKFFMKICPDDVLATLKANWSQYSRQLSDDICNAIKFHQVLCISSGLESRVALQSTFVPNQSIVSLSQELAEGDCSFLKLPSGIPRDWTFLETFGVGFAEGLSFYIWILSQEAFMSYCSVIRCKRIFKRIQDKYRDKYSSTDISELRSAFRHKKILFLGQDYRDSRNWCSIENTVWAAPEGFCGEKICLKVTYGQELEHFFCTMLGISNASTIEVINDLKRRKEVGVRNIDDVIPVYSFLEILCLNSTPNTRLCQESFERLDLIVVNDHNGSIGWKTLSDCVWATDAFQRTSLTLKSKTALFAEYSTSLTYFFTKVLRLKNAGLEEFIADLKLLQAKGHGDVTTAKTLYGLIESSASNSPHLVRQAFHSFDLILISKKDLVSSATIEIPKWYPLSKCVWSARRPLQSRIMLSNHYPDLSCLFRKYLDVIDATPDMLVDELLEVTKLEPTAQAVNHSRSLITGLVDYIKAKSAIGGQKLVQLQQLHCWPCRCNENNSFQRLSNTYANDRQNYYDMFVDEAKMLDFSFQQIRSLKPLLEKLEFKNYLSEKVHCETILSNKGEVHEELLHRLKARVPALYQCAIHFGRDKSATELSTLKAMLAGLQVHLSSVINIKYILNGFQRIKDTGGLYIEQTDVLALYVSTDEAKREYALITLLPGQIIQKVLKIPLTELSTSIITSILQMDIKFLDRILIDHGIISGPLASFEETSDRYTEEANIATSDCSPTVSQLNNLPAATFSISNAPSSQSLDLLPARSQIPFLVGERRTEWRDFFEEAAKKGEMPTIQIVSALELRVLSQRTTSVRTDPLDTTSGHRYSESPSRDQQLASSEPSTSSLQMEASSISAESRETSGTCHTPEQTLIGWDFGIGFLGEEYFFILLKDSCKLPRFNEHDNWLSSLREYRDNSQVRDGISDIVYDDIEGDFTRFLLKQYDDSNTQPPTWLQAKASSQPGPKYFLEVKTTSGGPLTPFSISNNQFLNAKKRTFSSNPAMLEVYIFVRIYNFQESHPVRATGQGICFYVDPYALYEQNALQFEAKEGYSVFPTGGSGSAS